MVPSAGRGAAPAPGGRDAGRAPPLGVDGVRDHAAERRLVARNLGETYRREGGGAFRAGEAGGPLSLERAQSPLLVRALAPRLLDRRLQLDEGRALANRVIPKLLHTAYERAVAARELVEVLVAGHEVAERLRREQRL